MQAQDAAVQAQDAAVQSQEGADIEQQFALMQQNLTKFKTNISDLQLQLRTLEKAVKSIKKEAPKKKESVMRQPKITGFDVSEKISPALANFMAGVSSTAGVAQPAAGTSSTAQPAAGGSTHNAATTFITDYIRRNKLQDMTDRQQIHLNAELAALFQLDINDKTLTYFNLQKHLSVHFMQ
jgi:hypothetical protein